MTRQDIINGDCLDELKKIATESIDLVVTDPPYKVSQNYGGGIDADNLRNVASVLRTFPEISRVLKSGKMFACFYDNRILPFLFEAVKGTDLIYRKSIYLYRRWGSAHRWMGWMQTTDPLCFFVKGTDKPFYNNEIVADVKHDVYVKDQPEEDNTGHPAQKPLIMIEDVIKWCSQDGDLVLDPYSGSGTVAIACQNTNRNFIGFEIEKKYIEIINNRLSANPSKPKQVSLLDTFGVVPN